MMNASIRAALAMTLAVSILPCSAQDAKHTGTALSPTSFASFDRDYLGGGSHFIPNRLSPKDFEGELNRFKTRLQADIDGCSFFSCIALDLIENLLPDGFTRQDVLDGLNASKLPRFTQGAWGIAAANAENDPEGPDNMFIVLDDGTNQIRALDFLHPQALDIPASVREVLDLLGIEVNGVRLPTVSVDETARGPKDLHSLANPRGITTNRRGDFWVADMGRNRIVRYQYNLVVRRLIYMGSLNGLNHPMDVALVPAGQGMGEMLAIANTGGNSVRFAGAYFEGEVNINSLPAHSTGELTVVNGSYLISPVAVAADPANPDRLYLSHSSRKVVSMVRTGAYEYAFSREAQWPFDGEITSLKCDRDGDILAVDRIFSFMGKFTPQLDLVFTTGGYSDGSDPIERNLKTGFRYPKYIAVGNQDDIYVSELWEGFTGVQRFNNWPRFMDRSATLRVDCQTSAPPEDRVLTFGFALTKKDEVAIRLYRVPDGSGDHQLVWQGFRAGVAGPNSFTITASSLSQAFDTEGTYRVEFEAQNSEHPGSAKDLISYAQDFGAPEFLTATAALGYAYFNPDHFAATAGFNISREADVVFKAASKDISGTPTAAQFVTLGSFTGLQRLTDGTSHILPLNIAQSEVSKILELQPLALWAELSTVPCGTSRLVKVPLPAETFLYMDRTNPGATFQAFPSAAFNPYHPAYAFMPFTITPSDNSGNLVEVAVDVYRSSDLVHPVRRGIFGQKVMAGTSVQWHWDGLGDDGQISPSGLYVFSASLSDLAGNLNRVNSAPFRLDSDAPAVALTLPGSGLEFTPFLGQQALLLKNLSVNLGLSVQEALPKDVVLRLEKVNPANGGVTGTFTYGTVAYNGTAWPATVTLDPVTFPGDGVYALSVYGNDQVGNSSSENPTRSMASPQIGAVRYIWVDHFPPLVNAKLIKSVIRSGGRTDLVVSAYHQGVPKPFDFSFTVELFHGTTKLADFASGVLSPASPTVVIPFNHSAYLARKGRFTFKVHVTANVGRVGNGQDQSADLYVDVFPPQLSGADGMSVPRKFYLSGQVGDPNLVNDLNANGFENYQILWKAGAVTALPADLTGWSSAGVTVPMHAVDRGGPHGPEFPLSPVGDNQEAITSAFGSATLAYLDGGTSGANFTPGSTYTALLTVKEKGKPAELTGATSVLRTFKVENPSTLRIGDVTVNGTTSGNLDFDAAKGTLNVAGTVTGGDPVNALLRLYAYSKQADLDGDGLAEPIAARLEKGDVVPGQPFAFQWDGKDGKGSYVKDGDYRLALVLEQAPAGRTEGPFDMQVIASRDIKVKTPLRLVEGTLSPLVISSAPASTGLPGNTANFRYKSTKPSFAYLEILDQSGNHLFDVGPEANQDGAGVFHVLSWNAADPASGLPVAEGTYRVRPYAVSKAGDAAKAYYLIPDSPADHYQVVVTSPQQETPELGLFATPLTAYGNSDAIWSSRPSGQLWKMAPVTLTGSLPVKIRGTQTLRRYQPAEFYGDYFRRHTQARYFVKSRIGIERNKRHEGYNCDDNEPCTNRVGGQDWVYMTTASGLLTEAITWGSPRPLSYSRGNIYFDSPEWEGIVPGSKCVTGASDDFFCEEFNMELVRNGRVLWTAIFSANDELLDIIYQNGAIPPGPDLPSELFRVSSVPNLSWSTPTIDVPTYISTYSPYILNDPDVASGGADLPRPSLTPGQSQPIVIPRMTLNGGVRRLVNPEMYAVDVSVGLPPGGTAVFTKPYFQTVTNTSLVPNRFMVSFSGHLSEVPAADQMEMPIEYTVHLGPSAGLPEVAVPGVPFPFPPSTGCGLNTFRDAAGQDGVDIWATSQGWVRDFAGNPVAFHANSGCDYVANLPTALTLQPGETVSLPLAGLAPAGTVPSSYLFANNGSETEINVSGVRLIARIEGGNVVIRYPVDGSQAQRVAWNPAANTADDDPVLAIKGNAIQGYMQVGDPVENFYVRDLIVTPTLTQPNFVPVGQEQNLLLAYQGTAVSNSYPLPTLAQTAGEAWKSNPSIWKRAVWLGGADVPEFHWGPVNPRGLEFTAWDNVTFQYIDETPNRDFQVFADNRGTGTFTPEIAPLAAPKRLIPIHFDFPEIPISGLEVTSLMARRISSGASWEPVPFRSNLPAQLSGRQLLAFWDVTNRAGSYYLRLLARNGAGQTYQVTTSIQVGVELQDEPTGPQEVFSPLKQASLIFPQDSRYQGLVALDVTDPKRLPGFAFGNLPKGLVVDVTPSGLIFDEPNPDNRPQLVFNLRRKDVEAMGGLPDRLGEIGIYYLNEKTHALEKAAFSATIYNLSNPAQHYTIPENPELFDGQVLELKGRLDHTSLYGSFSLSAFVTLDPAVSPTTSSTIVLSGTGSTQLPAGSIHLYVSSNPVWTPSATLVGTASVGMDGRWSKTGVPLPQEGKNYIFASIGAAVAGSNEPTNSILVLKDGTKPTVAGISFDPPVAGAGIQSVQAMVTLSEPGEASLFVPQIFGGTYVSWTREDDRVAVFSLPLTNLEGGALDEGEYTVFVTGTDLVGNQADATLTAVVAVDRTAPALTVDPIAFTGRVSGSIQDNYKLGQVRLFDQAGALVKTADVTGKNALWKIAVIPSDFPSLAGKARVVGYDLAGNPSKETLIALDKLFPGGTGGDFEVLMKDDRSTGQDGAVPNIVIRNHTTQGISGFTVRLWLSRAEAAYREVTVDPGVSNPCGVRYTVREHPDNGNLMMIDAQYPAGYVLAAGQSTPDLGLVFGLHYKNPASLIWDKANDWSWTGISATMSLAANVTLYGADGSLLAGAEPSAYAMPQPPAPPAPDTRSRVTDGLQALWFFHEGHAPVAGDVSGVGIPMDLSLAGSNAEWLHTGGIAFNLADHNAILQNRTPNGKLLQGSTASEELTLEAWLRPGSLTQSDARILGYGPGDGGTDKNWEALQMGRNLQFRLRTSNSAAVSLQTQSNPLATAGATYHVVMTYSPYNSAGATGGMRIYVNGALAASNQESGTLNASGTNAWNSGYILFLGNRPAVLDKDWQGSMLMAAVYSKALSSASVIKNRDATVLEPALLQAPLAGATCEDRLIPTDIVDGPRQWREDKSADGAALLMNGTSYAKGLGGQAGASGATSFLLYNLDTEGSRLGLTGQARHLTGFTGLQSGGANSNTQVKISRSTRKPSDQDWLNNAGSVTSLFTSNNGTNLPLDLDISGARWLFLGQSSPVAGSTSLGDFAELRVHYDAGSGTGAQDFLAGIEYRYYEGSWDWLPEFSTLSPLQRGFTNGFDLSPRLRQDLFAFEFDGFIRITTAGTYTFYTLSDDGSQLIVDGRMLVDNNGVHPRQERSGAVYLDPGMHSIRVTFFDKTGDQALDVEYQGPGVPRSAIPPSVLFRPASGSTGFGERIEAGLQAYYNFLKKPGPSAHDLAFAGLPLDLDQTGSNVAWIEGGGVALLGADHNSVLENRTPNSKLANAITQTGEMTFEAWIETANLIQSGSRSIFDYGHADGNDERNFSLAQEGRNLQFRLRNLSNAQTLLATTGQPLASGTARYHIALTYKPYNPATQDGGMRVFVNGVQAASNTLSSVLNASGTNAWKTSYIPVLGNRAARLDKDWEGKCYLVAVYNRALSAEQVSINYRAGIPKPLTGEAFPLGVTTQERPIPFDLVDGRLDWLEDKAASNRPLEMDGVTYRTGLGGAPQSSGALSWLLYDLERERTELEITQPPQRLTGFAGKLSGPGDVRLFVKTSCSATMPSLSDWLGNVGGAVQRLSVAGSANVPFNLDLQGAKWLWLAQSTPTPADGGEGIFGQVKLHFGSQPSPIYESKLAYRYYEGDWSSLPDFDALTPIKAGLDGSFNINLKNRADDFAFEYRGFIKISASGSYTFFTNSDDGSRLFIDGVKILDNDGSHGMREISGTVTLAAGYHAFKVHYFDAGGDEGLEVKYQGPGISKVQIPADVLFHSESYGYGLDAKYFEGTWNSLPDFSTLVPGSTSIRNAFLINPRNRPDYFGFTFDGLVFLPTAGEYTFYTNSDDGSRLYIDGTLLVDNDGWHAMQERSGVMNLTAGYHRIQLTYFDRNGGDGLEVRFKGPGIAKTLLPSELLFLDNPPKMASPPSGKEGAIVMGGEVLDRNYTMTGTQWFKIPLSMYSNTWASKVFVALDDMDRRVMQGTFRFENGPGQNLYTWFQSFQAPYTRQNDLYFSIELPETRTYKVRWWFE